MKNQDRRMDEKKFRQIGRRGLLKLAPVLALGAFAVPSLQEGLLKKGLGFSDWASARLFRSGHLAPTFDDAELTPFTKFPINGYDVDDPGVIFENWNLTVSGAVKKAGDYTLAQVQALPLYRQNTRHICVEGWDVIGRFGGARLSDFLNLIGADLTARYITVNCADDYYESLTWRPRCIRRLCCVTKCMSSPLHASTARRCVCRFPRRFVTSKPST